MRAVMLAMLAVSVVPAQTASEAPGVAPEWDIRANLKALVADVRQIEPLLRRVDVDHWVPRGAPDVYIHQLDSSKYAVQHLANATENLSQSPEKLSAALEVFFQMERAQMLMESLRDGVRKWQSENLANRITEVLASNMRHREGLAKHIRDVASLREEEFEIVNKEAQRCRGMLTSQPPPSAESKPARSKSQAVRP